MAKKQGKIDMYAEITKRVDAYYEHLKRTNLFYQAIFSGTLTAEGLAIYLRDIKESLKATIKQCAIGAKSSRKIGANKLAAFFETKIKEETGHDMWAQEDFDNVKKRYQLTGSLPELSQEMKDLVAYNTKLVTDNPQLYLVYMLFAEYFTVIAVPTVLEALEKKCKIPGSLISVLTKHADLDRDHVEEWRVTVKECEVDMDALHAEAMQVLQELMDNYDRFWNYVGACNQRYGKNAA